MIISGRSGIAGIIREFEEGFAAWHLWFPRTGLAERWPGEVSQDGWIVLYQWGMDQEVEFLDVYAEHRMTDDSHYRIRADGRREVLPAFRSMALYPADAAPEEVARIDRERETHDRRVKAMWRRKWKPQLDRIGVVLNASMGEAWNPEVPLRRVEACGPIKEWRGMEGVERIT